MQDYKGRKLYFLSFYSVKYFLTIRFSDPAILYVKMKSPWKKELLRSRIY